MSGLSGSAPSRSHRPEVAAGRGLVESAAPEPARPAAPRRRLGLALALALAGLVAVVVGALAGVATRRSDSGSLVLPALTAPIPRPVFLAIATGTVALLLVLAALVLTYMRPDDEMPLGGTVSDRRHPLFTVFAVTLPMALIVGALVLIRSVSGGEAPPPPTAAGGGGLPAVHDEPIGFADVAAPIVAFVAVLIVSASIARRYVAPRSATRFDETGADAPTPESPILEVLDDGLDALLAETDPRRAVIRAYARMEQAMARRGWARRPAEAPTEYVARVLSLVPQHEADLRDLTDLYVFARFSEREITAAMRDDAISVVQRLRVRAEGAADGD